MFKKHFSVLFLLELGFWFSLLFFLVYVKKKLLTYISLFEQYGPQLAAIQQAAQENVLNNNAALEILTAIESTTKDAIFFGFITVPLVILIIWCIFQGGSWYILKEKKGKDILPFFLKFTASSFVLSAIFILLTKLLIKDQSIYETIDTVFFQTVAIGFAIFYFLLAALAVNEGKGWGQFIKRFFFISIRRWHNIILPILLSFIIILVILFLFFVLFNSHLLNNYFFLSPAPLIMYFIGCLIAFIFFKVYLQTKVAEI